MTQPAVKLEPSAQKAIAEALNQCLSETVVATMLAQNFHWNVKGMNFGALHALFQEIYEDHFAAQDDLAERVRAIEMHAEGQLANMLESSKVKEHDGTQSDAEMVRLLMEAEETLSASVAGAGELAAEHGDALTEDLMIGRGRVHEKFAWMLRAHLK